MKNAITIMGLLFFIPLFSQKFPQFYVNHSNDTIECKIINFSNRRVNVLENGKKISLTPKKIKSFASYTKTGYRVFTILKNDQKNFYEENIIGKLSYYQVYTSSGYTGILTR